MLRVSFVVPVRDRAAALERCLAAITRCASQLELEPEIIVVDHGSRDASGALALAARARVVDAAGEKVGALRNLGARSARGDVLAFVDADVFVGAGWAAAALDALAATGAAAAGSPSSAPPDGNWVQRTYDLVRTRPRRRRPARWLPSGALAVRSDAFAAVGGFDPTLSSCEDVDLSRRLRAAGHRLVCDPGLYSVHGGDPRTLRGLFEGEMRRGAANLRVSLRRRALGELPSLLISLAVLALLVSLPLALGALAAGRPLPLYAVSASLAVLLALRAARMAKAGGWRRLPASLVVGAVYEIGRAVALVAGSAGATSDSPGRWRRVVG